MKLKGNFETFFLASILQLLCSDRKTGILKVTGEGKSAQVVFRDGAIVYAIGSQAGPRLGNFLLRKGVVSGDQMKKCAQLAKQQRVSIGKILVEKGFVSTEILEEATRHQVEEVLFNLFLWSQGEFEYRDGQPNLSGVIETRINTMRVVLEASRRVDEMTILTKSIPSEGIVFKIAESVQGKDEIKLNSNEWRILSLIDGQRCVRQVITASGYDQFAVYKILYALLSSGLIQKCDEIDLGGGDKKQPGLSAIATVYFDILQGFVDNMRRDLGRQVSAVLSDALARTDPSVQSLFAGIDPDHEPEVNIDRLLTAMQSLESRDNAHEVLFQAFRDFFDQILEKTKDLLGDSRTESVLDTVDTVLDYINKYQTRSDEKDLIVKEIRKFADEARGRLVQDQAPARKKEGVFSFLKR